jgi:hypothetical protein
MSAKKWTPVVVALVVIAISLPFLVTIFAALMEALAQVVTSLEGVAQ